MRPVPTEKNLIPLGRTTGAESRWDNPDRPRCPAVWSQSVQPSFGWSIVEQGDVEFELTAQMRGLLMNEQGQVKLRVAVVQWKPPPRQAGKLERSFRKVLQNEHHLKQGAAAGIPARTQLLDKLFERNVLMGISVSAVFRTRRRSSRKLGLAERSVRRTRLLTKNPIRLSSSLRDRDWRWAIPPRCHLAQAAMQQHIESGETAS